MSKQLFVSHYLKDLNEEEFEKMKNFLYKAELLPEDAKFGKEDKYLMFQTKTFIEIGEEMRLKNVKLEQENKELKEKLDNLEKKIQSTAFSQFEKK
eukprot:gene8563-385_t